MILQSLTCFQQIRKKYLMEKYEKPVIGVSLTRTAEGTVRPVEGRKYNGVFYQTPETAVNVLARMVAYHSMIKSKSGM